ncbi:TetR/AcrR family transcriptional regulator [Salininema proteolyticum]|uniref:TetR/AcrR family transcriptional regulator n=1 Tax=Salininema proteolyticum TaxID=1607685 RepID=A0ABV8U4V1_9ACTN
MPRAGLTRDSVIESAAALADERGLDRLSMSALARELGVKDASLYGHVKSLADLKLGIALSTAAASAERLAAALAGLSGADALRAFANDYRAFAREHPGRHAATRLPVPLDEVSDLAVFRRYVDLVHSVLRGYGLDEPDRTDAVRFIRSMVDGFTGLEASGGFNDPRAADESWQACVEALDAALTHWPIRTAP